MSAILGNLIVIAILAVIVFFCGRSVIRGIRHEINGGGCAGCGGSCAGCSGVCSHSAKDTTHPNMSKTK